MTDTSRAFFSEHTFTFLLEPDLDAFRNRTWTVYTDIHGKLILVEEGLTITFREGETLRQIGDQLYDADAPPEIPYEKWVCHQDPDFVRSAGRVSERDLTWEEAAAFYNQHKEGPLPPIVFDDDLSL